MHTMVGYARYAHVFSIMVLPHAQQRKMVPSRTPIQIRTHIYYRSATSQANTI